MSTTSSNQPDGSPCILLLNHHESQSQHKCNDGAPPRVRVLVLVELCEEGLEVVGVWDALALEELLASGLRALDEEAHGVSLKLEQEKNLYNTCGRGYREASLLFDAICFLCILRFENQC